MEIRFKFGGHDMPYYFKDEKFHKGTIRQRSYREIFTCGDFGETIVQNIIIEYKINNEWIEESMLFKNEADVKASPMFAKLMASIGLK